GSGGAGQLVPPTGLQGEPYSGLAQDGDRSLPDPKVLPQRSIRAAARGALADVARGGSRGAMNIGASSEAGRVAAGPEPLDRVGADTLEVMRAAPRYNAWQYRRITPFLGRRVCEVGSGIGNMSALLASWPLDRL